MTTDDASTPAGEARTPHPAGPSSGGPGARLAARLLGKRRLARAPIWLFRARLGALFGSRMILLEHVGRSSGARRFVVLEVVDRPERGTFVVASGFGERAQWFRNVVANPRVRVTVGSRRPVPATAHVLSPDEADRALAAYREAHPGWWERFRPVVEHTLGEPVADVHTNLPLVTFRLDTPR